MDDRTPQENHTDATPRAPGDPTGASIPEQHKKTDKHIRKAIRTYYSDIAETVKGRDVSMTEIALAEKKLQTERPTPKPPSVQEVQRTTKPPSRAWGTFIIILASVLVLGGGGIFGFLYWRTLSQQEVVPEEFHTTLIPTNDERTIDVTGLTRNDIIARIEEERTDLDGTLNTIVTLVPVDTVGEQETLLPARDFLRRLDTQADTALLRSVLDDYSLGLHLFDRNHGFLIVKTDFFENAFAGMLRWEDAIADDLPFLTQDPSPRLEPKETASTSGDITLEPIDQYEFRDVIIANRDARALVNTVTGDIRMLYSFPNKNTLVITTNPNTLVELFDRLTTVRRQ